MSKKSMDFSLFNIIDELGLDGSGIIHLDGPTVSGSLARSDNDDDARHPFAIEMSTHVPSIIYLNTGKYNPKDFLAIIGNPAKNEYIMSSDPVLVNELHQEIIGSNRGYWEISANYNDAQKSSNAYRNSEICFDGTLQERWVAAKRTIEKSIQKNKIAHERRIYMHKLDQHLRDMGGPLTVMDTINANGFTPKSYVKLSRGEAERRFYSDGKPYTAPISTDFKNYRGAYFVEMLDKETALVGDSETCIMTKDKELIHTFQHGAYNTYDRPNFYHNFYGFADEKMQEKWNMHEKYAKKVDLQIKRDMKRTDLSAEKVIEAHNKERASKRNLTTKRTLVLNRHQEVLKERLGKAR